MYKCEKIENCEESGNAFNRCDNCALNYAFKYDIDTATEEFSRSECLPSEDLNCHTVNLDGTCSICKDGFSFNVENKCENL